MRRTLIVPALLVAGLAGCGGGDSADDDPANAVPAASALYAEATIRPDGDVAAEAKQALVKIMRTDDPIGKIEQLLDDEADDGDLDVKDVERWIGSRVALFVPASGLTSGGEPPFGFVLATRDEDLAREQIEREAKRDGSRSSTYRDVRYWLDKDDGTLVGVTDGWVVGGQAPEFRSAVDTIKGGAALAGDDRLESTRDAVGADDAVAFMSLDTKALRDTLLKGLAQSSQPDAGLDKILKRIGTNLGMSVTADGDGIRAKVALVGADLDDSAARGAAESLADLPAQAWLAMHIGKLAPEKGGIDEALSQLPAAARGEITDALRSIERETGVDVERDLLSWMGDASVAVSGTTTSNIAAALNILSTDGAGSVAAVGKIETLIRRLDKSGMLRMGRVDLEGYDAAIRLRVEGLEQPIYIAANRKRLVLGVGDELLRQIEAPASRLGDSPQYKRATALLGDGIEPAFVLDIPQLLRLVESVGEVSSDGEYKKAKPYLDAYGTFAIGGQSDDDAAEGVAVVGLR